MLHEIAEVFKELMNLADSDDENYTASAFFTSSPGNIKTSPLSEADVKDVGRLLPDVHSDEGADY